MKRLLTISLSLFLLTSIFAINKANAQIIIETGPDITPEDMVEKIVGDGVAYDNVTFQGADISRGIFSNGNSTNLGLESGIFLTSGSGNLIPGPNNSGSAGANNGMPGHSIFMICTSATTYDAAVLEFDFIPETDTLRFQYVFGSEEYNEYVNSTFNDVFGFFVTGPHPVSGYYVNENIALVPGTSSPVKINTVNNGNAPAGVIPTGPCENCQYFNDNTGGMTLQYDGSTVVMTAYLIVVPCETYHMVLGVADAGDGVFDSGIFIQENSFTSPKIEVTSDPYPQGVSDNMIEGCVEVDIIFTLPYPEYAPITVFFDLSGSTATYSAGPGLDFEEAIPTQITFEEGQDSVFIHVISVKDGIIEGEEILEIVVENTLGCIVRYDTVEFIIQDYIEMNATTSPSTMICSGQEVDLWVNVYNGFPPHTYLWEPGGFTNDSITVSPVETTTYKVIYHDICMESDSSLITITAMPLNYNILSFSFEAENNPSLGWDVIGEIYEDSISLDVPIGTNLNNLVATYSLSETAWANVNGVLQENGVSANDFTNLVTYEVNAPGGCMKNWFVNVNLVTGNQQGKEKTISIFPNPANEQLHINNASGYEVSLVNNLGKEVLTTKIDRDNYSFDVSTMEVGIYYLHFTLGEVWFVEKVVVGW